MSIQIQLRNFQGHKATNIELSDAINVLCGDTDAGKSSIIRALYWVCFNRPTGDGYIRKGADSMSVSINIYDAGGCVGTVTRGIDKKGNYYKLNGEEFVLNSNHIETLEEKPDTVITLFNEKKYIVRESIEDIIDKIIKYQKRITGEIKELS